MILDVGCGCSPIGNVNVDLMVADADQRWDLNPRGISNFIKASAEFLPFQDNSFDLVHSSHLLEHLEDPFLAVKEFLRVSRRIVKIILPFWLFGVFDFLAKGREFGSHKRWLRQNHKHSFLMNPLGVGSFRLRFINLLDAVLFRKKAFGSWIKIPIPFETETVIIKNAVH